MEKKIRAGAILSYISIAVNILAGLFYTPWMVQQLGKSEYGLYTLAYSLINFFMIDFGLSSATARYISKYRAEGNQKKIDNFLGVIYKLYLLIDAVIFIALILVFVFIEKIYVRLTPIEMQQFKVVYIIAATYSIFHFPFITQNGILTAYEKFISLKIAEIIYRFLLVGLNIVALSFGWGLYALVAINSLAGVLTVLFKFIIIKTKTPVKAAFNYNDKSLYVDIFKFSIWITVGSLAGRLVFSIVPSILGIVSNSTAIAVFGVVTVLEGHVYTFTTAINGMFMPRIAKICSGNGDERELSTLLFNVGRFQFGLNALIVVGFFLIGKEFVLCWMGPGYEEAFLGTLLVLIPGLFYNSLQIAHTTAVVQNKVKMQSLVSLLVGGVNIVLVFPLSTNFGMMGACFAIFISLLVRAIVLHFLYYKVMKINIPGFIKVCYLKFLPIIICTILIGFMLNYFWHNVGWLAIFIKAIIIVIVFLINVFIFGLTKVERKKIINKLIKCKQ